MRRWPGLLLAGILVVGVAVVIVWPRGATPTDQAQVRKDFESRTDSAATDGTPAHIPAAGIYSYDTSGSEELKLGVLPTETRPYPKAISATVVDAESGCYTMTLHLLEQHSEDTTYCVGADGAISLAAHEKHQQVGPMNPTATMTCDPDVLVEPDDVSVTVDCTLTLDGGPKKLTASLKGTTRSDRSTTVKVGGSSIDAIEVDTNFVVTGDLTGTWRERVWFADENALPLRIARDLDLDGLAAFTEDRDSTLVSLTPEG